MEFENVFLVKSKKYDFEGFQGYTLSFIISGDTVKVSSSEDLQPLVDKNGGAPVKGKLTVQLGVAGGRFKAKYVSFLPSGK